MRVLAFEVGSLTYRNYSRAYSSKNQKPSPRILQLKISRYFLHFHMNFENCVHVRNSFFRAQIIAITYNRKPPI